MRRDDWVCDCNTNNKWVIDVNLFIGEDKKIKVRSIKKKGS